MSQGAALSSEPTALTKEEEKKQPDEEPMDMVVEKQEETDHKNVAVHTNSTRIILPIFSRLNKSLLSRKLNDKKAEEQY